MFARETASRDSDEIRGELRQAQRDFVAVEVEFHAAVFDRDDAGAFDLVTFMNRLVVDHRITATLRVSDPLQNKLRRIDRRGLGGRALLGLDPFHEFGDDLILGDLCIGS